jgi:hypothetical protein
VNGLEWVDGDLPTQKMVAENEGGIVGIWSHGLLQTLVPLFSLLLTPVLYKFAAGAVNKSSSQLSSFSVNTLFPYQTSANA